MMKAERMAKERMGRLASSLRTGSLSVDSLCFEIKGDQLQDEQYQRYRLEQAIRDGDTYRFLTNTFVRVWIPEVIMWE